MKKVAIFVEGHSELIFVREYLLKKFEYQNIDLECRTLFSDNKLFNTDYDIPNTNASHHFHIINVGSDSTVITRILKREPLLWNAGYERIVGLRDMYCDEYKEEMGQPREIKPLITQKFVNGFNTTLKNKALKPELIHFCFAIMELEAWLLGIPKIWEKKGISYNIILEKLNIDFSNIDPEITFLHPTEIIKDILALKGEKYDKHEHEVNSFLSYIEKEDFEDLENSQKCNSFKGFVKAIN